MLNLKCLDYKGVVYKLGFMEMDVSYGMLFLSRWAWVIIFSPYYSPGSTVRDGEFSVNQV